MKFLKWMGILISVLVLVYWMGPRPQKPVFSMGLPHVPSGLSKLEKDVVQSEKAHENIKPDNQARIVWNDPLTHKKTPYSVVYLHGFSASQAEGAPIHTDFAKRYGCNLYLSRLYGHGLSDTDAFKEMSPGKLMDSALEAIAIAQQLGEKIIILSTSTGCTLAMYIVAQHPELPVAGLINYSPLIDFYPASFWLLDKPWGLQIARLVIGGKYQITQNPSRLDKKYWTTKFRLEGAVALKSLVAGTMTEETFKKIKAPFFMGYYYKNEAHQDFTVSVKSMKKMFQTLSTPDSLKREVAFPNARNHVIASYILSKEISKVRQETFRFAEEILKLKPRKD